MPQNDDFVLAETRLEERDGATWVSGLCPYCWERLAFLAPPRGAAVTVWCPNGHSLRIVNQTSEGAVAHAMMDARQR
jgi:hypothetical protein